jgi:hypothetical protein
MTEVLLPCPFCGKCAGFVERADYSSCYVICSDCGARGPGSCDENEADSVASENGDAEPGELPARRLWNRRHRIAGQAELVEATVRECAEIANRAYRTYSAPTDWDYGAQDACTFIEREILAALAPLSQSKGEGL